MTKIVTTEISIAPPEYGLGSECEAVMRDLPEWFGIENSILFYRNEIDKLPTVSAVVEGRLIGFIALKRHFESSAELFALGLNRQYHRTGIGTRMMSIAQEHLRQEGIKFLQVKTISASSPDSNYARTRNFYQRLGFTAIEEFPDLWSKTNPCLLMVKNL